MEYGFQKFFLFLFAVLSGISIAEAQYTVHFEIDAVPASHANEALYLAGSFNDWNPSLADFRFSKNADGKFVKQIKLPSAGLFEYKITRGQWTKVECAANGSAISNRILKIQSDTTIHLTIAAWADDMPQRPPVSTRTKNVFVLDTAFYMPQLNRKRRIWIYLPEGYALSKKTYPVLYMHDGQNLFDALTSSYGEWGVDELMDSVPAKKQWIIVGIDHGNNQRLTEYNPFDSKFGKAEGDAYADFLAQTLKPYIDQRFRTKKEVANTAIAGSSMGGLISFYTAFKYPAIFSKAGVFSPSFWIAPQLFTAVQAQSTAGTAFFFVCGKLEGKEMEDDMRRMYNLLLQKGARKLKLTVEEDGQHNERFWQKEMPLFLNWLNQTYTR